MPIVFQATALSLSTTDSGSGRAETGTAKPGTIRSVPPFLFRDRFAKALWLLTAIELLTFFFGGGEVVLPSTCLKQHFFSRCYARYFN